MEQNTITTEETFIQIKRNFDFQNLDNNKNVIEELNQFDFTSFKNKGAFLRLLLINKDIDKELALSINIDHWIQLGDNAFNSFKNVIKKQLEDYK